MMITYSAAGTAAELQGILSLQKANLARSLTTAEIHSQGFVTVDHDYPLLKKLNDIEKHIIAKQNDRVIAYLLAMTRQSRSDIPVLFPMFDTFDKLDYNGRKISEYRYLVVGQVCVDKDYRGQGILDQCYAVYRDYYRPHYDFAITEIAASNQRSLRAHRRIGFREINTYTGPDETEWIVVLWDWKGGQ